MSPYSVNELEPNYPLRKFSVSKGDNTEMLRSLLALGASPLPQGEDASSALHASCAAGSHSCTRVLLEKHPRLCSSIALPSLYLPIHCAIAENQVESVRLLLEHEYKSDDLSTFENMAGTHEFDMAFNVNAMTAELETPLYMAVRLGLEPIVRLLLQHTAECRQLKRGNSRLRSTPEPTSERPSTLTTVEVNARCGNGASPLVGAVARNSVSLVRLLLEHDADPDTPLGRRDVDSEASSQFDCVGLGVEAGFEECVDALLSGGAHDTMHLGLAATLARFDNENSGRALRRAILNLHVHKDSEYR